MHSLVIENEQFPPLHVRDLVGRMEYSFYAAILLGFMSLYESNE